VLKDANGDSSFWAGSQPSVPWNVPFPSYNWDKDLPRLAREIESAGQRADKWRETGNPGGGLASLLGLS
jgi:hypothetical protein